MNVIALLEFELTYLEVAVQQFTHNASVMFLIDISIKRVRNIVDLRIA